MPRSIQGRRGKKLNSPLAATDFLCTIQARSMSAIGPKRPCAGALQMSALGGKADIDADVTR